MIHQLEPHSEPQNTRTSMSQLLNHTTGEVINISTMSTINNEAIVKQSFHLKSPHLSICSVNSCVDFTEGATSNFTDSFVFARGDEIFVSQRHCGQILQDLEQFNVPSLLSPPTERLADHRKKLRARGTQMTSIGEGCGTEFWCCKEMGMHSLTVPDYTAIYWRTTKLLRVFTTDPFSVLSLPHNNGEEIGRTLLLLYKSVIRSVLGYINLLFSLTSLLIKI